MDPQLLTYYEAIEKASADMLSAAREGNWDEVVKLEGACVLLISQLKHAAQEQAEATQPGTTAASKTTSAAAPGQARQAPPAQPAPEQGGIAGADAADTLDAQEAARRKSRIMQRILVNDAEIRHLAEPWLQDINDSIAGRRRTLH